MSFSDTCSHFLNQLPFSRMRGSADPVSFTPVAQVPGLFTLDNGRPAKEKAYVAVFVLSSDSLPPRLMACFTAYLADTAFTWVRASRPATTQALDTWCAARAPASDLHVLAQERAQHLMRTENLREHEGILVIQFGAVSNTAPTREQVILRLERVLSDIRAAGLLPGPAAERHLSVLLDIERTSSKVEPFQRFELTDQSLAHGIQQGHLSELLTPAEPELSGSVSTWLQLAPVPPSEEARLRHRVHAASNGARWWSHAQREREAELLNGLYEGERLIRMRAGTVCQSGEVGQHDSARIRAQLRAAGFHPEVRPQRVLSTKAQKGVGALMLTREWEKGLSPQRVERGRPLAPGAVPLVTPAPNLIGFDPFVSAMSYNTLVVGCAGSGKRFLAKEVILSKLASGGAGIILSTKASYGPFVDVCSGRTWHITPEGAGVNPLAFIRDAEHCEEQLPRLVDWLLLLLPPEAGATSLARLELGRALMTTWKALGPRWSLSTVAQSLRTAGEHAALLAEALSPYIDQGPWGRLFSGTPAGLEAPLTHLQLTGFEHHPLESIMGPTLMLLSVLRWRNAEDWRAQKTLLVDSPELLGDNSEATSTLMRSLRKLNAGLMVCADIEDLVKDSLLQKLHHEGGFAHYLVLKHMPHQVERLREVFSTQVSARSVALHTSRTKGTEFMIVTHEGLPTLARLAVSPAEGVFLGSLPHAHAAYAEQRANGQPLLVALREAAKA